MARIPKAISPVTIRTTDIIDFGYTVPANTTATAFLVLTNASSAILSINIFVSDGLTDFIFCSVKIPAGVGKKKRIIALPDEKLGAGFSIKVKCSTIDTFNAFLSISEISNS